MGNSSLATYRKPTNNHSGKRRLRIRGITPHMMAAVWSGRQCADYFASTQRQASSNYCIGNNGDIAVSVDECNRAWTSSNENNDQQMVTIEVSNSSLGGDYPISDKAWDSLVKLAVDICKRNGIKSLNFNNSPSGSITCHDMFAATNCPGPYLRARLPLLANKVNSLLSGTANTNKPATNVDGIIYKVQVGAYKKKENAVKMSTALKNKKFEAFIIQVNGLYKVQVGAYGVKANAESMKAKLKKAGFAAIIVNGHTSETPDKVIANYDYDAVLRVGDIVKSKSLRIVAYPGTSSACVGDKVYVPELGGLIPLKAVSEAADSKDGNAKDDYLSNTKSRVFLKDTKVTAIIDNNHVRVASCPDPIRTEPLGAKR